jgi:predicted nucleic acid-binding Zn ribbon protein
MHRASDFLGMVVRRFERPEATLAWLSGVWPSIVGKPLAAHTQPTRCESGLLEIAADAKAWQQQIEGMKRELRDRVNRAWGGNLVREVEFLTAKPGLKRADREIDNAHVPFVRRRRA